jgi:hypothetical protein
MAAALVMGVQARANIYDISYSGTDQNSTPTTANGWLNIVGGVAMGGSLTVVGPVNPGTYTLVTGQDTSPYATFSYDNLVSPGSTPFLNLVNANGGLLWSHTGAEGGGTEFNMWYNNAAIAATLSGYYSVVNEYGLMGHDGGYEPQTYGTATLTAVPEPTTMVAGALLLLPFGMSTLRMLRNRVARLRTTDC